MFLSLDHHGDWYLITTIFGPKYGEIKEINLGKI